MQSHGPNYLDIEYLCDAYECAKHSPDPSTQNGAVIVSQQRTVVRGWNRLPSRISPDPERLQRPLKYEYIVHAECDVIYQAARLGVQTFDATMYCPWYSCPDCARAIIQSGIRRVVGHDLPEHQEIHRWQEPTRLAMEMLEEAGVQCEKVSGKLGCSPIRMNGRMVYP